MPPEKLKYLEEQKRLEKHKKVQLDRKAVENLTIIAKGPTGEYQKLILKKNLSLTNLDTRAALTKKLTDYIHFLEKHSHNKEAISQANEQQKAITKSNIMKAIEEIELTETEIKLNENILENLEKVSDLYTSHINKLEEQKNEILETYNKLGLKKSIEKIDSSEVSPEQENDVQELIVSYAEIKEDIYLAKENMNIQNSQVNKLKNKIKDQKALLAQKNTHLKELNKTMASFRRNPEYNKVQANLIEAQKSLKQLQEEIHYSKLASEILSTQENHDRY